jgi:carbon monoxide dehydrogenase subunit G
MRAPFVLLLAFIALAGSVSAAGPQINATVERGPDHAFLVDGSFNSTAAPVVVWQVLTDYEGMQRYISTIHQSTIVEREPGRVKLDQRGVAHAFMFSLPMHMVLDVREVDERIIEFHDTAAETFTVYEGAWEIAPMGGGTRVVYRLKVDLAGRYPAILQRSAIQGIVKKLLTEVATEMESRSRTEAEV